MTASMWMKRWKNITEPISQPGDVFILGGRHRVMCGDSTKAEDMQRLMAGDKAQLIITDPPYNVNYGDKADYLERYAGKGHRNTSAMANDNQSADNFHAFLLAAYNWMYEAAATGAAIYVFHAESEGIAFRETMREAGWKQAQCLIWGQVNLCPWPAGLSLAA